MDTEITRIKGVTDYANPAAVPATEHTQVLQDLMVDYMKFRNIITGTYITNKSGAKGIGEKNEKTGIGKLRQHYDDLKADKPDQGGKMTKTFAEGMRLTFDNDALVTGTPIAHLSWGTSLGQHILTAFQAFPGIPDKKKQAIQRRFVRDIFDEMDLPTTGKKRGDVENLVALTTSINF